MSALTGSGFGIDILEETRTTHTNNGDHDKFSHYVHKDDAMRSLVYGEHIMALCGKVWVVEQEGDRFPVCPECREIFNSIPAGGRDE
jgi:hypothetical protein